MSTPAYLLGFALLFWGWQSGLLLVAIVLALLLEGSRHVGWRWDLSAPDFSRLWDYSIYALVASGVFLYLSNQTGPIILDLLEWTPLFFYPMILCQAYSVLDRVPFSVFSLTLRRKNSARRQEGGEPVPGVNLAYPYLSVCVLASGVVHGSSGEFYAVICLITLWAIWTARPSETPALAAAMVLSFSVIVGYGLNSGLFHLHQALEARFFSWYSERFGDGEGQDAKWTRIGKIGSLKQSERILYRVQSHVDGDHRILLRNGAFDRFRDGTWFATHAPYEPVASNSPGRGWKIVETENLSKSVTVTTDLGSENGILALPIGTGKIEQLAVPRIYKNRMGVVRFEGSTPFQVYRSFFTDAGLGDGPPTAADLQVPENEAPVFIQIARELGFTGKSHDEIVRAVSVFFDNFSYSLSNRTGFSSDSLKRFLFHQRAGHCELFATSTVLMLRQAGIPARYATGFSVQEFSRLENTYVVRERHAHSWTLVYLNGEWQNLDTTPFSWVAMEASSAPFWQPMNDLGSYLSFLITKWRWREKDELELGRSVGWIAIPLLAVLIWRIYRRKRIKQGPCEPVSAQWSPACQGTDSDFYLVENKLNEWGLVRHPWESLGGWMRRIEKSKPSELSVEDLREMLRLHYRYRFDPIAAGSIKKDLAVAVRTWLERHQTVKVDKPAAGPSPGFPS